MSFKNKYQINPEFSSLFEFKSEKDELKHDAKVLMFRFLSEIERLSDEPIYKKDFAEALNTSRSFITQLFKGDKIANLTTLAKLQKEFKVIFEVRARPIDQVSISADAHKSNMIPIEWIHISDKTNESLRVLKGGNNDLDIWKKNA